MPAASTRPAKTGGRLTPDPHTARGLNGTVSGGCCHQAGNAEPYLVSIIIATYGRSEYLRNPLEQVLRQSCRRVEVIVVDQTPHHPVGIARFLRSLDGRILYTRLDRPNLTRARNLGLRLARGRIVLFIDDDVKIPQDFVCRHVRNYEDPQVCAVAGRILDARSQRRGEPRACGALRWHGQVVSDFYFARRAVVEHARGANMSFLRDRALAAGGFDERFTGNALREDTDFCLRYTRQRPGRMVFDPEACLYHFASASGGCRSCDQALDPRTYANELYFLLKHCWKWLLPYHCLNLLVRYCVLRADAGGIALWRWAPRRMAAMIAGGKMALRRYHAYTRKPGTP